jgi:hypothetical protein
MVVVGLVGYLIDTKRAKNREQAFGGCRIWAS